MIFVKKNDAFNIFINLIEDNIHIFGEALDEAMEKSDSDSLSDEQFIDGYVDGMKKLIDFLHKWVYRKLSVSNNYKQIELYNQTLENPSRYGFRFANDEITIGKIYLYYVYATTKRKASKSDCIKLERYALSLIGKECMDRGIVH